MGNFNAGAIEASLTLSRTTWQRDLKQVQREIADLERTSISVMIDADTDNAKVAMDNLEMMLDDLDQSTYTPKVDLLVREAEQALAALEARLDALDSRNVVVGVDADADNALVAFSNVEAYMDLLENDDVTIGVDVNSAAAESRLIEIGSFVQALDMTNVGIDIDVNGYSSAIARLATLEGAASVVDGKDVDIDINTNQSAWERLVGSAADGGSGGYLGLLKIALYAIAGLSPIITVAIGAMTAAIVGFAAALVAALGPLVIFGGGIALLIADFVKAKKAGEKLTPQQKALNDAYKEFKGVLDDVKKAIAPDGYGVMAVALQLLSDILPDLVPMFNAVSDVMVGVLDSIKKWIGSSEYKEMLDFFGGFGIDMLKTFLDIGGNLLQFFGRLFDAIAPFARQMMQGLEDITKGWADWAAGLENNDAFQEWIDNALYYGPQVLDFIGDLFRAFGHFGDALRPLADPMFSFFDTLVELFNAIPTDVLTKLIVGFAGLWGAMHIIAPVVQGLYTGLSLAAAGIEAVSVATGIAVGPILIIGAAIAGLVATVVYLWNTSETFRNAVIGTWEAIKNAVMPIINDISSFIKENWGSIKGWVMDIWGSIQSIVTDAMVIIQQVTKFVMAIITALWNQFGDDIMQIIKGAAQFIGSQVKGFFQILKGIFHLIKSVLTGDWRGAWESIKSIGRAAVNMLGGMARGFWNLLKGVFGLIKDTVVGKWKAMTALLRDGWNTFTGWIKDKWNALIGWFGNLGGRISNATSNLWDGIKSSFKNAINAIIDWWNGLSLSVDIPDKIPGLPDSFTISTPNVPRLARGAFIDEPTLAMVGEGREPEIVAPESKLEKMANAAARIDYKAMAQAFVDALLAAGDLFRGISPDQLDALIAAAGADITIDARGDGEAVRKWTRALSFELRKLGYGGRND